MSASEFVELLEFALLNGAAVLFQMSPAAAYRRIEPRGAVPSEFAELLASHWLVGSPHLVYVVVDDDASSPDRVPANCLIAAYFGGVDGTALYVSSVSARSDANGTLKVARGLANWLKTRSRTGIQACADPPERGEAWQPVKALRYTEGAGQLVQSGLALRQRGVTRVRYGIASAVEVPKAARPRSRG